MAREARGHPPRRPFDAQALQELAPLQVRRPKQRAPVEEQQVEDQVDDRHPLREPAGHRDVGDVHPLLQPAEARPAGRVERHQPAADAGGGGGRGGRRREDLGIAAADVEVIAGHQPDVAAAHIADGPDAVPLQLKPPLRVVGGVRQLSGHGEHRTDEFREHRPPAAVRARVVHGREPAADRRGVLAEGGTAGATFTRAVYVRERTGARRACRREVGTMNEAQRSTMATGRGFIAALDQSGGSTPKALGLYGIEESEYSSDEQMFDLMHEFRSRIVASPVFGGDRILAAILFEQTMDRDVDGVNSVRYLWERKHVVPFVKVDEGLAQEADGVQLMKPFTRIDDLLERAVARQVFGTKMRSVVKHADAAGITAVLDQQFVYAGRILDAGLLPIVEPEVDIHAEDKPDAETLLKSGIVERLDAVPEGRQVMLKLSIPTVDGFYSDLMTHPKVLRVVALSGGYSRDEADRLLARNPGLIASFSRALTEGLRRDQTDAEFDEVLDKSIASIYEASLT